MRRKGKYYRSFGETLPCSQGPLCVLRLTRFQEEFDWNITWQLYVFAMDYKTSLLLSTLPTSVAMSSPYS
jgi:hypothetical protein